MSLFRLDASIFPAASASAELAGVIEAEWTASHPGEPVVRRDLVEMKVDKPFMFALRDSETGLILMSGYVGRPAPVKTAAQ